MSNIIQTIQTLEPGAIVHLYEFEMADGTFKYFAPYNNSNLAPIQMYDYDDNTTLRTYYPLPINAGGFELKVDGAIGRPGIEVSLAANIQTANTQTSFKLAVGNFDDLLGNKVIRRTTFAKYVVGGANDPGSGSTPIEFPRQKWIIDRIVSETKESIEFELNSPFDLDGVRVPGRTVVGNACAFEYQGASPTYAEHQKIGGCSWHRESKLSPKNPYDDGTEPNQVVYTFYVNEDDEYVVANSASNWDAAAGGDSIAINTIWSSNVSATQINANGTFTSVTVKDYWQATQAGTKTSMGTPADSNSKFNRVRVHDTYNAGTTYNCYTDSKLNPYVTYSTTITPPNTTGFPSSPSNGDTYDAFGGVFTYVSANSAWERSFTLLWQAKVTHDGQTPAFGEYWKRGDLCGKRLKSCNMRFNAQPVTPASSSSLPKAKTNTNAVLPFGGFPGSKRFV